MDRSRPNPRPRRNWLLGLVLLTLAPACVPRETPRPFVQEPRDLAPDLADWADGHYFADVVRDLAEGSLTEGQIVDEGRRRAEVSLRRHVERFRRLPREEQERIRAAIASSLSHPSDHADADLASSPRTSGAHGRLLAWRRARSRAILSRYDVGERVASTAPILILAVDGSNLRTGTLVREILARPEVREAREPAFAARAIVGRELAALRRHVSRLAPGRRAAVALAWDGMDPDRLRGPALAAAGPTLGEAVAAAFADWLVREASRTRTDLRRGLDPGAEASSRVEKILSQCSVASVESESRRLWARRHRAELERIGAPSDPEGAAALVGRGSPAERQGLARALVAERMARTRAVRWRARLLARSLEPEEKAILLRRLPEEGPCSA